MKKSVRAICAVIIFFIFQITFSSCTLSQNTEVVISKDMEQKNQKTKLRFISSWGGSDASADTLQQVLNRFMESNPNIEIINESTFAEDFLHKLKTDFASGYNPDVFGLWPGSDIRALIKTGKVADLTRLLNEDLIWKASFKKGMWSYTTYEGRIYGLPLEIIYEGLFINKDLFDRYNVLVPTTYEELKQAIKIFKSNGIIPIAYNSSAEGTYIYQNIAAMLGGKEAIEQPIISGQIHPCYIDAVKYVKELYELGAFPRNAFTISSRDRNNLFLNKEAAMIVQGSWFIGNIRDNADTVDIIPFPALAGERGGSSTLIFGLGCGNFHMSMTAWEDIRKKQAAEELLRTLTSRGTANLFARQTGMLVNIDIDESRVEYSRLVKRSRELLNSSKELVGPPDSFVDRSIWEGDIVKRFPNMLEGAVSPQEVWDLALKRRDSHDK